MAAGVTAERILEDLHKYWASLASRPGPGQTHGVLRACAMTLFVAADETDDRAAIRETLGAVMRDHPHRAIVVQVAPGAAIEYTISAQCWLALGQREQVCCEQIELTAAPESLAELAPVLAAITVPDLPIVVWCRSARLAEMGVPAPGKLIVNTYEFPDPAKALALVAGRPGMADLGWTRITRWREIVAQIFADPGRRELLPALDAIEVRHSDPQTPSTAYYMAGWIAASLGRELKTSFAVTARVLGGIEGLTLSGGGHMVAIRRVEGAAVLIEIDALKSCTVCPRLTEAELLSSELAITGRDAVFERALGQARRLAGLR
jgi:glucose-6-phosphate dehydrogenase assembly protein OpcA